MTTIGNEATTETLSARLTQFLETVDRTLGRGQECYFDLAFPAGSGHLLGSETGRTIWETQSATMLKGVLLDFPALNAWFGKDGLFHELQFRIASVANKWSLSGKDPQAFVQAEIERITASLFEETTISEGLALADGVTVDAPIQLPFGLAVLPIDLEQIESYGLPLSKRELVRLPNRGIVALRATVSCNRSQWGGLAAVSALGFARVSLHRLQDQIWLTTGVSPRISHEVLWHPSDYPPGCVEHFPSLPRAGYGSEASQPRLRAGDLTSVLIRNHLYFGVDESPIDEETWLALWMAQAFAHSLFPSPDPLARILLAYATIDGLLRDRNEDDGVIAPRVALLVGEDEKEGRSIRKFMEKCRDIRGTAAHGQRPPLKDVGRAIGRLVTDEEIQAQWATLRETLYARFESKLLGLLRRTLCAYLWTTTDFPEETPQAGASGLTRSELLAYLTDAKKGNVDPLLRLKATFPSFFAHASSD